MQSVHLSFDKNCEANLKTASASIVNEGDHPTFLGFSIRFPRAASPFNFSIDSSVTYLVNNRSYQLFRTKKPFSTESGPLFDLYRGIAPPFDGLFFSVSVKGRLGITDGFDLEVSEDNPIKTANFVAILIVTSIISIQSSFQSLRAKAFSAGQRTLCVSGACLSVSAALSIFGAANVPILPTVAAYLPQYAALNCLVFPFSPIPGELSTPLLAFIGSIAGIEENLRTYGPLAAERQISFVMRSKEALFFVSLAASAYVLISNPSVWRSFVAFSVVLYFGASCAIFSVITCDGYRTLVRNCSFLSQVLSACFVSAVAELFLSDPRQPRR